MDQTQVHAVGFSAVNLLVIRMITLIPLNQLHEDEQTLPSQLGDVSFLMNLLLHPFIFVMSLVFPVRETKGNPSSVKETYRVSLHFQRRSALTFSASQCLFECYRRKTGF